MSDWGVAAHSIDKFLFQKQLSETDCSSTSFDRLSLPVGVFHRFLFQKHLSETDRGALGRVVLPRGAAEAFLPHLSECHRAGPGRGLPLTVTDAQTGTIL